MVESQARRIRRGPVSWVLRSRRPQGRPPQHDHSACNAWTRRRSHCQIHGPRQATRSIRWTYRSCPGRFRVFGKFCPLRSRVGWASTVRWEADGPTPNHQSPTAQSETGRLRAYPTGLDRPIPAEWEWIGRPRRSDPIDDARSMRWSPARRADWCDADHFPVPRAHPDNRNRRWQRQSIVNDHQTLAVPDTGGLT